MQRAKVVGNALGLALVLALALASPSQAAKSKTYPLDYSANVSAHATKLLDRGGYKLTGSCTQDGPVMHFTNGGKPGFIFTSTLDGKPPQPHQLIITNTTSPLSASFGGGNNGVGQVVVDQTTGGVVVISYLADTTARGKDCTFDGVLTIVQGNERVFHKLPQDNSAHVLTQLQPKLGATCDTNGDITLTAAATSPSNAFAASFLALPPPSEVALFPMSETSHIIGPTSSVLSDMNLSTPSGTVSNVKTAATGCTVAGMARTAKKGKSRAFYAKDPTAKHKRTEFFSDGGLHLSASCQSGELRVFAASSVKNAILHSTVLGDGDPTTIIQDDFDSKPSKPYFMLDLASIHRSGQLVYARPDGHVTSINWSAANVASAYKSCLFAGIASSA